MSSKLYSKRMQPLVDKWASAHKELVDPDDGAGAEDYDGSRDAARKLRDQEEWRVQQLASGEAAHNSNFAPLAFDWRKRVDRLNKESAH